MGAGCGGGLDHRDRVWGSGLDMGAGCGGVD